MMARRVVSTKKHSVQRSLLKKDREGRPFVPAGVEGETCWVPYQNAWSIFWDTGYSGFYSNAEFRDFTKNVGAFHLQRHLRYWRSRYEELPVVVKKVAKKLRTQGKEA